MNETLHRLKDLHAVPEAESWGIHQEARAARQASSTQTQSDRPEKQAIWSRQSIIPFDKCSSLPRHPCSRSLSNSQVNIFS